MLWSLAGTLLRTMTAVPLVSSMYTSYRTVKTGMQVWLTTAERASLASRIEIRTVIVCGLAGSRCIGIDLLGREDRNLSRTQNLPVCWCFFVSVRRSFLQFNTVCLPLETAFPLARAEAMAVSRLECQV